MKSCAPSQTSTAWNGEAGRISTTATTIATSPAMLPISAYRGTPRAMTATPAGNTRNSHAVSAISGNAAAPEGCQTGPSNICTSG